MSFLLDQLIDNMVLGLLSRKKLMSQPFAVRQPVT
jgi:hypothetical protein